MIQILWHGIILREYTLNNEEQAKLNWKFFNGFLLPTKLEYKVLKKV